MFATCLFGLVPAGAGAETYEDVPVAPLSAPGGQGATPAPEVGPPPPAEAPDEEDADPAAVAQALNDEHYEELKEEVRQLRGVVAGRKPTPR